MSETFYYEKYFNSILKGDSKSAIKAVVDALSTGLTAPEIYLKIVCRAQNELGLLWNTKTITITQEHIATQISLSAISLLKEKTPPKPALGARVIVSTPYEDPHYFASKVIADFFYFDGWEVFFPGNNTPNVDLLKYIAEKQIELACFSITLDPSSDFYDLLKLLKSKNKNVKIAVGGQKASHFKNNKYVDLILNDPEEALLKCKKLLGLAATDQGLSQLLSHIGSKISEARHKSNIKQSELAKIANLDRAYLSALENGKQNASVAVLLKIASALNMEVRNFFE